MNAKIIINSFTLLVAASCLASFNNKSSNKKLVGQWFEYIGSQSTGSPTTLSDARTRSNYQFTSNAPNTSGSSNLKAVFVTQSEIDNNGTPGDLTDDMPQVDVSTTDGYVALGLAKDPDTGEWRTVTYNTATVIAN